MQSRRSFIVGAGAALISAPAVARSVIAGDGVALTNTAHPIGEIMPLPYDLDPTALETIEWAEERLINTTGLRIIANDPHFPNFDYKAWKEAREWFRGMGTNETTRDRKAIT